MSQLPLRVALALTALGCAGPAAAGELAEGAIAPPGECASAVELAPPSAARNPVAALFPPPGGSGGSGGLSGATGDGDADSGDSGEDGSSGAGDSRDPDSELGPDDVDVAAGSPRGSPGSSDPGLPRATGFDARGPCDDPGSGCGHLGGARPGFVVPPGGVLQRGGWIRFPDGSLIRAQRAGTRPAQTPNLRSPGGTP